MATVGGSSLGGDRHGEASPARTRTWGLLPRSDPEGKRIEAGAAGPKKPENRVKWRALDGGAAIGTP